ncbi:efflux RND transporter permease subunit [Kaarinaea lacus]
METPRYRSGGIAAWSIKHPVGVSMIALAIIVLGGFSLGRLAIDLHPHLIYPEIRVRILDPGVPATVMEDRITRQLEEQLAITEDAIAVQSTTSQGLSTVDLSFAYGKDIDVALRDASTRLDRAKRFLPDTIDPPVIYKRDPSQIPVQEFVVSSTVRDSVELRTWVDHVLRKWFLNLPGVAAAEVGGGLVREIHILPDQQRLAGLGLTMQDLIDAIQKSNREDPAGRLQMSQQELSGRISGRFTNVEQLGKTPVPLRGGEFMHLDEIAQIIDTHKDERLRVRANGTPGVKLSIQKQPNANTVAVVDVVRQRLDWLKQQKLIPEDIDMYSVADQSIYIRQALTNSSWAAISGAILAMAVVYLFLGNLRRTLIIGSAIPIAVMVTFVFMGMGGMTLNIMTLGGLALGVGMLVDNTIVMLENIYRHQKQGEVSQEAGIHAATEVNSAIVAATSTNLAAVLPFLFVGGLVGLLFRELIFTISAAILASMVVALTLVPALASRVRQTKDSAVRIFIDKIMVWLQDRYSRLIALVLKAPWLLPIVFVIGLVIAAPTFLSGKQIFLPKLDDGLITARIVSDPGITLDEMDKSVNVLEEMFMQQAETLTVFTLAGGSIFGRTEREIPNRTTITIQLKPISQRAISSDEWIQRMKKAIAAKQLAGLKVRLYQRGIRGIRTTRGDEDISLRIQGPDLQTLEDIAQSMALQLKSVEGLENISHTSEEEHFEISIDIDKERASALGYTVEDISFALRIALEGVVVTDFIDADRAYNVRLRLPPQEVSDPQDLEAVILFPGTDTQTPVYLGHVAEVQLVKAPASIVRDNQLRIVEISATVAEDATLGGVLQRIDTALQDFKLPPGYTLYDGGAKQAMQEGQQLTQVLLALAIFLVFVVMAVQYESLRNPVVIILSIPFAAIGIAAGITLLDLPISMPVWLGMIMLAGIVVNNAIVFVEYIEIVRAGGAKKKDAIIEAARLRLRPILMTTLTTVFGMSPLALGLGEGAEMLQPLAVTIVFGLSFSMLVSLLLVPSVYSLMHVGEKST